MYYKWFSHFSFTVNILDFDFFFGFAAICGFICGLVIVSLCQASGQMVLTDENFIKIIARIAKLPAVL